MPSIAQKKERPRIVIVGAGFAGIYVYLHLRRLSHGTGVMPQVTLISKKNYFLFTPLLHEVATGSVHRSNVVQPLRQIIDGHTAEVVVGEVTNINRMHRIVHVRDREFSYDYLVLATGSRTRLSHADKEAVFTLKNLEDADRLKQHIISCFEEAAMLSSPEERSAFLNFVVIGGGPTGVELAAEINEFAKGTLLSAYRNIFPREVTTHLVHSKTELVERFHPSLRKIARRTIEEKGLMLHLNTRVVDTEARRVTLESGEQIPTHTAVFVAGVEPSIPAITPTPELGSRGRIKVNALLHLPDDNRVFVLGDAAEIKNSEGEIIPQTAQAAVQEAKIAAHNILALTEGKPPTPFVFRELGQMLSLGRFAAGAYIGRVTFSGAFAWWLWRTVYVGKMVGLTNRIRVIVDWTIDLFYPRDISKE